MKSKFLLLAVMSTLAATSALADHGVAQNGDCVEYAKKSGNIIVKETTDPLYCRVQINGLYSNRKVLINGQCVEQYLVKKVDASLAWRSFDEEKTSECRIAGAPALGELKYQLIEGRCFEMAYYRTESGATVLPQDEEPAELCNR